MLSTISEQLTIAFFTWERYGRGWFVSDTPVCIEPPYQPFIPYYIPATRQIDDGRKPTFLSSLVDELKSVFEETPKQKNVDELSESFEELLPIPFDDEVKIKELLIKLPHEHKIIPEYFEQLLLSLSTCMSPISFEIVGTRGAIYTQIACDESDAFYIESQIQSIFPDATIERGIDISNVLATGGKRTAIVDFGLSNEFMRPVKTFSSFDPDSLLSFFGALENLSEGEVGIVQILFQGVRNPWARAIMHAVTNSDGSSFFADAPEMPSLAQEKINRPLYAVVARVVGQGAFGDRSWEIVKSLAGGFTQLSRPDSNELIPLINDNYEDDDHLTDVVLRRSRRLGMILNSDELMGLVHFPSASIKSKKLIRSSVRKTNAPPAIVCGHEYVLGVNIHEGKKTVVGLSLEQRLRHIYILGATGTGKSTLILNALLQSPGSYMLLDPHGDLCDQVIANLPEERINDVILFDPSDVEYPVGFNILQADSEIEKTVLLSDFVALFKRFMTSWGDQMSAVLGNAVAALLEHPNGGTLLDLRRFLVDESFREQMLSGIQDMEIRHFWKKEFPILKGNAVASILTRLDTFLRPKIIRNIFSQKTGLDFKEITNGNKILLVKIAQGIIGEENAYLLGSMFVSKLYQTVMARQSISENERNPFFLYIDEFQNFITPSMSAILSGGRKFKLGIACAHQDLQTLSSSDSSLANSIITNAGTRIFFRLGDFDARKVEDGFRHFDASDLMNLGIGEAIVRVERNEYDFNIQTYKVSDVAPEDAMRKRETIIALSRQKYGKRVEDLPKPKELPIVIETKPQVERRISTTKHPLPDIVERIPEPTVKLGTPIVVDEVSRYDTSRHTYLKTLIKKMAEQRGYRAVVEESVPEGGRVDVSLERDKKRIAVEVSVTTKDTWELHNIEKCLNAGYDHVVVCSLEKKTLTALKTLVTEKISSADQKKIHLFSPDELFAFLDQQTIPQAVPEQRIKGYRVRVSYDSVTEVEEKNKREAIVQVVSQALRRMKKENSN